MRLLLTLVILLFQIIILRAQTLYDKDLTPFFDQALKPFYFGVASGDPRPDGVLIWTKIIPEKPEGHLVSWEVATDTLLHSIVRSGSVQTDSSTAFTVKVFIDDLSPGTTYFYRFRHGETWSPTGRTKTAPTGEPDRLKLGVASCSDFQSGYFNAYGHLARQDDLDAVIHLGDYIYEYGARKWGPKKQQNSMKRVHIPAHHLVTLKDYRSRYAQHRLDPQLMECHRLHPFIVIWDDHEIANNVHAGKTGEEWERRESSARQAYFEWMPIPDNPQRSIIRSFTFGNLAELWMLDGRLEGRSPQVESPEDPSIDSPQRHMLGTEQTQWMLEGMASSKARWKIMGNQVVFSPVHDSRVFDRRPSIRMDRWDGYPAERQHIFDYWHDHGIDNIIVITGDVHTAWAFDLTAEPLNKEKYHRRKGTGVLGAEFITPSITSFNFDELMPVFITWEAKRRLKKNKYNPHLRYADLIRHGYMVLTLTPDKAQADWYFMKRKDRPDLRVGRHRCREIEYNGKHVKK